jgi:DNA-binding XRE family transcriptional regulator
MDRKYKNNIAEFRKAIGKTQKQLAADTEVSEVTIQNMEYGIYRPRLHTAQRIAMALNTEVGELFPIEQNQN